MGDIAAPVTVRVIVDFVNEIRESNEQNNSREEKKGKEKEQRAGNK